MPKSATQSYFLYNSKGQAVPMYLVEGGRVKAATQYEQEQYKPLARLKKGIKYGAASIIVGGLIGLIYIHVGPWGFVAIGASYLVGHFFGKAEREKEV